MTLKQNIHYFYRLINDNYQKKNSRTKIVELKCWN